MISYLSVYLWIFSTQWTTKNSFIDTFSTPWTVKRAKNKTQPIHLFVCVIFFFSLLGKPSSPWVLVSQTIPILQPLAHSCFYEGNTDRSFKVEARSFVSFSPIAPGARLSPKYLGSEARQALSGSPAPVSGFTHKFSSRGSASGTPGHWDVSGCSPCPIIFKSSYGPSLAVGGLANPLDIQNLLNVTFNHVMYSKDTVCSFFHFSCK